MDPQKSGGLRVQGFFKKGGVFDEEYNENGDLSHLPLVSVITIVYNGAKHIRQTILSVVEQSYENIEYIVIDGGSSDGTLDIIREFNHLIDYWVSEPDRGISDAFNKGIALSTGKIIGLINADDWYSPGALENVAKSHLLYPKSIIHGDLGFWTDEMVQSYIFRGNDHLIPYRASMNHPTVFVPREVYEKVGLFSLKYRMAMDIDWLGRAKLHGVPFHHLETVLANMRRGGVSDQKWLVSYWESAQVRHNLNVSIGYNIFLFLQAILLTSSRKFLELFGFEWVIRFYRRKLSIGKFNF